MVFLIGYLQVFFNLFFEAEPLAAILFAHGTHGRSKKFVFAEGAFVSPEGSNFETKGEERAGVLGEGQLDHQLRGLGSTVSSPFGGFGTEPRPQMHFGCTKSLVVANVI